METIKAWQCVGCGRLEGAGQCVGVCRDVPVELVSAEQLRSAQERIAVLESILRHLAFTHPHPAEWERTWNWLQQQARAALADARPS